MRRREFFVVLAGGSLLIPAARLLGDSVLVSSNPTIAEFDLQSLEGRYTPIDDFYIRNHFPVPPSPAPGLLLIAGFAQKPLKLSGKDLRALKVQRLGAVLECSGNGTGPLALASDGMWEGWRLLDVLALARPTSKARFLHLMGADGFRRSVPLAQVGADALLVTKLNGQPLTPKHGAPWRALFPGWYGMESVKWLSQIALEEAPLPLLPNDYVASVKQPNGQVKRQSLPPVLVKSVITYPVLGQVLHPGTVTLRGLAWSGSAKIAAVEITTDGGKSWRLATLDSAGRYEWVIWHHTVSIGGTGVVEFAVRAVDAKGSEQPATRDPNRLDPYANNTIERIQFVAQ